jgi:dTDP-4-amino-4,6-dideoxygalactose transaminase
MTVPLLDLKAQYREIKSEVDSVWFDVMENAAFIGGSRVAQFERDVATYVGTEYAVACGNGTDALFLIMAALGIGKGDEVITTPFTFWATVEAIVHTGATPVFVDVEADTYNMDVSQLEAAVTERTKAIMPVHIFGQCVDMDVVRELTERRDLLVIEDACQAIGSSYKGKKAGSLGDAAAFSFFPSKNLGCAGDGGMVTTNSAGVAAKVRLLANHGSSKKYFHAAFGANSRLDSLQAGILSVKLPHLDRWNGQRREAACRYVDLLRDVSRLALPIARDYGDAVHHLYILKAETSQLADRIMAALSAAGIGTAKYYPMALHEQEAMGTLAGFVRPSLPVAESCDGRTFAIPLFPGITVEQQEFVAATVRTALAE